MGDIIGRGFDTYVQKQVIKRQEKLNYGQTDLDVIRWNNSNNAFLRLSSGVNVSSSFIETNLGLSGYADGNSLARHFRLFSAQTYSTATDSYKFTKGAKYSFDSSYGFASPSYTSYGLVPPPGITSATIKSLNRGSLREATVNIKCHNLQQFQIIEVLYLRLKYSLLLEWGHSMYFDNDGILTNSTHDLSYDFLNKNLSQTTVLQRIQAEREASCGNYDAFFGLVTNFDWTVNPDGGYDINMIARAAGDVIESLKINSNTPSKNAISSPTSNARLEIDAYKSTLNRLMWTIAINVNNYTGLKTYAHGLDDKSGAFRVNNGTLSNYSGIPIGYTKSGGNLLAWNEASMWNFRALTPGWQGDRQSYIKLGTLLRIIESFLVFYDSKHSNEPIFKIDYDYLKNYCFTFPRHASIDPRVCLIPYPVDVSKAKLATGGVYYEGETRIITKTYFPDDGTIYTDTARTVISKDYGLSDILNKLDSLPEAKGALPILNPQGNWINVKQEVVPITENGSTVIPLPAAELSTDQTSAKIWTFKNSTQLSTGAPIFGFPGIPVNPVDPNGAIGTLRNNDANQLYWLSTSLVNQWTGANNHETIDPVPYGTEYIRFVQQYQTGVKKLWRITDYGSGSPADQPISTTFTVLASTDPAPTETGTGYQDANGNISGTYAYSVGDVYIETYQVVITKYNNTKASGIIASSTGANVYKDLESDNNPGFKDLKDDLNFTGRTMEIRVNMEYIAKTLSESIDDKDGSAKLYNFLKKLLSGIQNALGNVNNFEVVYNEDTNTFKIIDNTLIPELYKKLTPNEQSIVQFLISAGNNRGNDGGSFVHNINFRTKLSNAFATMATIGAQSNGAVVGEDATALSRWNVGITDRIIEKRVGSGPEITENTDVMVEYLNNINAFQNIVNKTNDTQISDAEIAAARNAATDVFKTEIAAHSLKGQNNRSKGMTPLGFIPFDLELNMVGLSGPRIYESYTIDTKLLPNSYRDSIQFICSGISHTISNGEWKTTLNSICGPKQEGSTVTAMAKAIPAKSTSPPPKTGGTRTMKSIDDLVLGPGLEPVKNLISSVESNGGDYNIYNFGVSGTDGIRSRTPGTPKKWYRANAYDLINLTIQEVRDLQDGPEQLFAVGKYQCIPNTLKSAVSKIPLNANSKFDAATQETIGDYLLLESTSRLNLAAYLKNSNLGDENDLAAAIQDLAQEFASLPVTTAIRVEYIDPADGKTKKKMEPGDYGDVVTGVGNTSCYGSSPPNHSESRYTVADVAQILIKSRKQYSGNTPKFVPTYYKLN
jgi:hypothetical protein